MIGSQEERPLLGPSQSWNARRTGLSTPLQLVSHWPCKTSLPTPLKICLTDAGQPCGGGREGRREWGKVGERELEQAPLTMTANWALPLQSVSGPSQSSVSCCAQPGEQAAIIKAAVVAAARGGRECGWMAEDVCIA